MKTFYKELIKQGHDVPWLAKQLGISHQAIYRWKLGKISIKPKYMLKLSKLLGINMDTLIAEHHKK